MMNDDWLTFSSAQPPVSQAQNAPAPARLTCEGCGSTKTGDDPLDALDAADRAGWRLVEMGPTTSQLCPLCVHNRRVNGGGKVVLWRLCDEFIRRLAGKPRRELPLMPPRGAAKEVVVHAAMMSAASVFAPEFLDRQLPLSWWMRRRVRIEPLATARQVAIVLLVRAGRWNKTVVARSFGRDPAAFHWAKRAVENRNETDDEFRRRFEEAEQRFRESLELIINGGLL